MGNPNLLRDTLDAVVSIGHQKLTQQIFNIRITPFVTSVRIRFVTIFNAPVWVSLNIGAEQIRGGWATLQPAEYYEVDFAELPQDSEFRYIIAAFDPSPTATPEQIVRATGLFRTGRRTAAVRLRSLKEIQGEGEITYNTRLYDWQGDSGAAVSVELQYGRAHMDPDGNAIGDPFGPAINLNPAPDQLLIYTVAQVSPSSFWDFITGGDLGVVGSKLPDSIPASQLGPLRREDGGVYTMAAQVIVPLPTKEGPFNDKPFEAMSPVFDYVFVLDGWIDGNVHYTPPFVSRPVVASRARQLLTASAKPGAGNAMIIAGDTALSFNLTVEGRIVRGPARSNTRPEYVGDIAARWLGVAGRSDGCADLVALERDNSVWHARIAKQGEASWRNLGAKFAGEPALTPAPCGTLHVFGLDENGALLHGAVGDAGDLIEGWDRWDSGFSGLVSCTCNSRGEAHLFARRDSRTAHASFTLQGIKLPTPKWEILETPFTGPVIAARLADDGIAALGCDDQQIFWLKYFAGSLSKAPDASDWQRAGSIDNLFRDPAPDVSADADC